MANQPSPTKRHVTLRINVETCRAVEKKYAQATDASSATAFIRALEDATRDVELSADDLQAVADEVRSNTIRIKGSAS